MFTLIMLILACAGFIGFCVVFAIFTREWDDTDVGNARSAMRGARIEIKIVKLCIGKGSVR